jgi:hypothetical protein
MPLFGDKAVNKMKMHREMRQRQVSFLSGHAMTPPRDRTRYPGRLGHPLMVDVVGTAAIRCRDLGMLS